MGVPIHMLFYTLTITYNPLKLVVDSVCHSEQCLNSKSLCISIDPWRLVCVQGFAG